MTTEPRYLRYDSRTPNPEPRTPNPQRAQKYLIMQNKPNFPNAQMNISTAITMDYANIRLRSRRQNKPNSNPIQTQFPKGQNERKFNINKGL